MKIILNIPLKTVNRHFVLYKVIVLPRGLSGNKFVTYSIEHSYLGIDNKRHDSILLTQADLSRCIVNRITIFPANTAVYTAQKMTCLSSIYFQENRNICSRKLLLHYKTPTLLRHGNTWTFHFPEPRQVSLRCLNNNKWTTSTETLSGAGFINNATGCCILTNEIYTLPELHGDSHATFVTPDMFVPDKASIITDHEVRLLDEITTAPVKQLDAIQSQSMASQQSLDVDSLLHAHYTSLHRKRQSYWHLVITTSLCAVSIIAILCYSLRSFLCHRFLHCSSQHTPQTQNTESKIPSPSLSVSNPPTSKPRTDDLRKMSPSLRILCKRKTTEATSQANPCPQMDASIYRILQCLHLPDLSQT